VHSLIKCINERDDSRIECKECIVHFIINFKDNSIIYLPLINSTFAKLGFRNDPKFKMIIDKFKECGDLEDLDINDITGGKGYSSRTGRREPVHACLITRRTGLRMAQSN
jgi:hypothetical protein